MCLIIVRYFSKAWCALCMHSQVVHATLYTKCELSKVQCCSILVSIKIVFNFHACKAHDMYSIIYTYIYIYNIYLTTLNPVFCRQSLNWWPCTGSRGVCTSLFAALFCRENDHRDLLNTC